MFNKIENDFFKIAVSFSAVSFICSNLLIFHGVSSSGFGDILSILIGAIISLAMVISFLVGLVYRIIISINKKSHNGDNIALLILFLLPLFSVFLYVVFVPLLL